MSLSGAQAVDLSVISRERIRADLLSALIMWCWIIIEAEKLVHFLKQMASVNCELQEKSIVALFECGCLLIVLVFSLYLGLLTFWIGSFCSQICPHTSAATSSFKLKEFLQVAHCLLQLMQPIKHITSCAVENVSFISKQVLSAAVTLKAFMNYNENSENTLMLHQSVIAVQTTHLFTKCGVLL